MDHSMVISVAEKEPVNTWDTWHLIPTTRPTIPPPPVKTKYVTIPGRNGAIDISTWPTGHVNFQNIDYSVEFIFADDGPYGALADRYSTIMEYLHGQQGSVYLTDDPQYYYLGRFTVKAFKPGKVYSTITIEFDLQPNAIDGWATNEGA